MEKRLKVWKRLLAVVLCFLLVAGMIPSSAIAAQEKNTAPVISDQIEAKTTTNEATATKLTAEQEGQATSSQTDEGQDSVQAKSTEVALQGEASQGEMSQEQQVEATATQGATNETESAADTTIQADTKNEQATEATAEAEEITDTKETAINQSEETTESATETSVAEATTVAGAKSTTGTDKTEATETTDTTVETTTTQSATEQVSAQSDKEETDNIQSVTEKTDQLASSSLQNPRIVKDTSMTAGQKVTWDCVWFGSYPQSEVTSSDSVYSKLASATGWDGNNDITLSDGTKYRRMKKGDATYATSGSSYYYDWEDSTTYHYFKYEPIKWRVLEVSGGTALLVADIALDDQPYNTNNTSVTWETSSMRSWLNGYGASSNQPQTDYTNKNFIDSAFTQKEQTAIQTTNVENKDNLYYSTEGGNNTSDKVFLLSESDVYSNSATSHGFVSNSFTYDEARRCKSSTYAKAMGTYSSTSTTYKDNCWWWLRSPGDYASGAAYVSGSGYGFDDGLNVSNSTYGARPALNLNLSSSNLYTYAGTVCSDDTVDEKNEPGTYLIKYNANGGKNAPSTQTKKKNKSLKLSTEKPTRKGYTFQGWATSKSSTKVAYKSGATVAAKTNKNMTLYAVWKANTYKVAFNKNGGTGKMTAVTYTYGKSYTLKANAFKRTGYTFKGWNKKADGSDKTTYTNKAKVKNLSSTNGKTVTLYAQWKINKYKITYRLNGGTNNKANPSSYKVTTKTITLKNPTRKGYKFKGWYTSSSFKSSTKVTKISKGSTGNKTLYAKWSKK